MNIFYKLLNIVLWVLSWNIVNHIFNYFSKKFSFFGKHSLLINLLVISLIMIFFNFTQLETYSLTEQHDDTAEPSSNPNNNL